MGKWTGITLLATLLLGNKQLLASAPVPECIENVPLSELIANPDIYHDKTIRVVAYVTIEFEYMTACPSENDTDIQNCLWLNVDDGIDKTHQDFAHYESNLQRWKQFHRETVVINTTFDKTLKGHFSMWPGGLRNVTEVFNYTNGCIDI